MLSLLLLLLSLFPLSYIKGPIYQESQFLKVMLCVQNLKRPLLTNQRVGIELPGQLDLFENVINRLKFIRGRINQLIKVFLSMFVCP